MASQEMLKKLLEEFDEKEAQAREEVNIVNVRIEELEKRIGSSRQRLEKISNDRQKIGDMMERYVNGNFFQRGSGAFGSSHLSSVAPSTSSSPAAFASQPAASSSSSAFSSSPVKSSTTDASAAPSISSPMHSANAANASPALSVVASLASSGAHAAIPPFGAPTDEIAPFFGHGAASANPVPVAPDAAASAPASFASPTPTSAASQASSSSFPAIGVPTEAESSPASPFANALSSALSTPPATASVVPTPTPLSSLSAASLFSSLPAAVSSTPTETGENPALPAETPTPFASPTPSTPASLSSTGGLSAALMQSMPFGGNANPTPQPEVSKAGKFDMMDLFAPLGNDEAEAGSEGARPSTVVSEPEPHVAEQALAANQFFQSPNTAAAPDFSSHAGGHTPLPPPPSAPSQDVAATQDNAPLNLSEDAPQIQDLEEESDDTVKSINDALRGLFR